MNKSNCKHIRHLALISLVVALAGCQESPLDNTELGTNEECSSSGSECLPVTTLHSCIDADGDSYGVNCTPGADCDDTNPDIWANCPITEPGEFVFGRSTYSVQENQGILEVEVNRVQGTTGAVSVTYTTDRLGQGINPFAQDNDFSQPGDYDGIFSTLNFADGEASQTFTVTIYNDTSDEGDETFGLKLLDPSGGAQLGAGSSATVTIVDDDRSISPPPAPDESPLSITSTSGTLARGKTLTINGSGFGGKSPAAPLAWETFDNGVNGARLSTDPDWPAYRQGGARYSNISPHSGGLSAYNRVEYDATSNAASSPFGFATNNYFFPKSDEIYYSYVYRQDGTSVGPAVQKLGRINSTGNLYNGLGVLALSDSYVLYQPGNNIQYPSDDNGSGRFFDTALLGRNTWTRHQLYGKLSQPAGAKNGLVQISVGESLKTFANIVTRDQGETFQYNSVILGLMFANTNWETGAVHDMYIDDVYIDNTLARVELCEGGTWATRGVCNPQPPTKWSDSSVQVTVNPGEWPAGSTAYLYVVNAAGDAGAKGYQVLVSNEECNSTSGLECRPVTTPGACIDADGDSYGVSCTPGADCDDTNPDIWANCPITEPGEFVFRRSTYSVQENQGTLEVEVNRVLGTTGAVSVTYTTDRLGQGINPFAQDNDFSQPGDYDGIFNTLNFADGEASQTFTVTIYNDTSDEGDETFGLKLLDPSGGAQLGAGSSATVTIVDDDRSISPPPAPDESPLSITSTSGTLARGKTLTINGSGFGGKSPAAPLAWETFDNGVNGARLSTDPDWPAYRQGGARYSNISPHSGGLSAYNRVEYDPTSNAASSPFGFATNNYFFPKSDEIYYSYVYRQDGTSVGPAVQKLGRINSTGNLYNGLGVLALSDSYVLYQPGNNIQYPSDDNGSGRFFDTALLGRNTWTRHQLYGKLSQPAGAKNGLVQISVGESLKTFANIVTRDQGETFQYNSVILGLMFANTNWETGAVHDMYIDDVYIDNTLARVELCEGDTWATRGVCNPQPPTKWSDSSVQVTVNSGEWPTGTTAYLYVVNAAGDAGAKGYQVLVSN